MLKAYPKNDAVSSERSGFLDQQKDRLKGGLSLLLLYEVYDKCWCNTLSFFNARATLRASVQ